LSIQLDGLALPSDLVWTDQRSIALGRATLVTSLAGSSTLFTAPPPSARAITLVAQDDSGWLSRTQAEALLTLAQDLGRIMTLRLGARAPLQVVFDHRDGPAVELSPVCPRGAGWDDLEQHLGGDPDDPGEEPFVGTIRLLTIA